MLNGVMQSLRRKPSLGPSEPPAVMKHAGSYIRKRGNIPILVVIVMIVVFALVMYNEDIKYSLARRKTEDYSPDEIFSGSPVTKYQSQPTAKSYSKTDHQPMTKKTKTKKKKQQQQEEEKKERIKSPKVQELPITVDDDTSPADVNLNGTVVQELPITVDNAATAVANVTVASKTDHGITLPSILREEPIVTVPDTCDLSHGDWIYDDVNYPLYREDQCEFVSTQVACLKNGRKEDMYQKWRWQPKDCSLPKYVVLF